MKTAAELMTENPVTIRVDAKVRDAVRILETLDIRHLPVVDEEGEVVGMVSDRDVRGLMLPYTMGGEYAGTIQAGLDASLASIMSSDVLSVEMEADEAEVVDLMLDHKIGAVPVVDVEGTLVGIVSYLDVLRQLSTDTLAAE